MVLRDTRTRSVDTRPVVSDSRRGERTPRVALGEDCNSVTVCLRPCLLVGCIRRFTGGRIRASWAPPGSPGRLVPLLSGVVRPAQRLGPASVFHESPDHSERPGSAFRHASLPAGADGQRAGRNLFRTQLSSSSVIGPRFTVLFCLVVWFSLV